MCFWGVRDFLAFWGHFKVVCYQVKLVGFHFILDTFREILDRSHGILDGYRFALDKMHVSLDKRQGEGGPFLPRTLRNTW